MSLFNVHVFLSICPCSCPYVHVHVSMSMCPCPHVHVHVSMSTCPCLGVQVHVYVSMSVAPCQCSMSKCSCPCVQVMCSCPLSMSMCPCQETMGWYLMKKMRPKNLMRVSLRDRNFSCFEQYVEYHFVTVQYNTMGLF
jgi:hypothetical protein